MNSEETLNTIALTRLHGITAATTAQLYNQVGSATAIMTHRHDLRAVVPDASDRVVKALQDADEALRFAEQEMLFAQEQGISILGIGDDSYPQRLCQCPDAPLVLYYKGNADLNSYRVINMVGTRRSTSYGHDLISRFLSDLKTLCPNTLVVSGLAYGIDIHAHRDALSNGFNTVGVLAHGLDDLYPPMHHDTALKMIEQGGLLTEYPSATTIYPQNFIRRNRIVAGMSDACILVESKAKGGGLITAGIARDYNRDVFAFPGAVGAASSEGCNNLIRDNGAALITSAADFVSAMGWETDSQLIEAQQKGIERQLFPELSADEQKVVDILQCTNDLQVNVLTVKSGIAVGPLTALLFKLEMKGLLKSMAGGTYHLLK